MKVVRLSGEKVYGSLTYTGIGEWNGRATADYVVEWLTNSRDADFPTLTETLAQKGNDWLSKIRGATRSTYRHTFVVAGFEEGEVSVALVSNFEFIFDQRPTVRDEFVTARVLLGPIRVCGLMDGKEAFLARYAEL